MRLRQQFLTKNECYKAGRTIKVKGVMVHSTGVNNPNASRYVPGDAEIGSSGQPRWNAYHAGGKDIGSHKFIKDPKTGACKTCGGAQKCVHAFIGRFADGEVGTVQTMPWSLRGWHGGGSSNNTHIGFEICEDGLTDPVYFGKVYQEAVELTAMLCKEYKLDPLKDGVVLCHQEGYRRGIASNHKDVLHWFPKHGKTMDDFMRDVKATMGGTALQQPEKDSLPKKVRVTSSGLNVRSGPGTNYKINQTIRDQGVYTIMEEKDGWGRLKSGAGWISLYYTKPA